MISGNFQQVVSQLSRSLSRGQSLIRCTVRRLPPNLGSLMESRRTLPFRMPECPLATYFVSPDS